MNAKKSSGSFILIVVAAFLGSLLAIGLVGFGAYWRFVVQPAAEVREQIDQLKAENDAKERLIQQEIEAFNKELEAKK
jgi:cell division protein FtsB